MWIITVPFILYIYVFDMPLCQLTCIYLFDKNLLKWMLYPVTFYACNELLFNGWIPDMN